MRVDIPLAWRASVQTIILLKSLVAICIQSVAVDVGRTETRLQFSGLWSFSRSCLESCRGLAV